MASEAGNLRGRDRRVHIKRLSSEGNVITSHHIFGVKKDGEVEKMVLKFCTGSHKNKDQ